jgi:hypothetical protein
LKKLVIQSTQGPDNHRNNDDEGKKNPDYFDGFTLHHNQRG